MRLVVGVWCRTGDDFEGGHDVFHLYFSCVRCRTGDDVEGSPFFHLLFSCWCAVQSW